MIFVSSFIFNVLFWTWAVGMHLLTLPLLLAPHGWLMAMGKVWLRGNVWLARTVAGIRYEVRGWENIPTTPCLIASKHQSAWDAFALPVLLDLPSFVLKRELMRIPVFGWYLRRYGPVPVDRSAGASALRSMLRRAHEEMDKGRSVVIFPEGTRVPPGETRPFHPGVAALYRDLGTPLVPVILDSGHYWPRRSFLKRPGTITITFLPPIPPGLSRREVMTRLSEDLNGEQAGPGEAGSGQAAKTA